MGSPPPSYSCTVEWKDGFCPRFFLECFLEEADNNAYEM